MGKILVKTFSILTAIAILAYILEAYAGSGGNSGGDGGSSTGQMFTSDAIGFGSNIFNDEGLKNAAERGCSREDSAMLVESPDNAGYTAIVQQGSSAQSIPKADNTINSNCKYYSTHFSDTKQCGTKHNTAISMSVAAVMTRYENSSSWNFNAGLTWDFELPVCLKTPYDHYDGYFTVPVKNIYTGAWDSNFSYWVKALNGNLDYVEANIGKYAFVIGTNGRNLNYSRVELGELALLCGGGIQDFRGTFDNKFGKYPYPYARVSLSNKPTGSITQISDYFKARPDENSYPITSNFNNVPLDICCATDIGKASDADRTVTGKAYIDNINSNCLIGEWSGKDSFAHTIKVDLSKYSGLHRIYIVAEDSVGRNALNDIDGQLKYPSYTIDIKNHSLEPDFVIRDGNNYDCKEVQEQQNVYVTSTTKSSNPSSKLSYSWKVTHIDGTPIQTINLSHLNGNVSSGFFNVGEAIPSLDNTNDSVAITMSVSDGNETKSITKNINIVPPVINANFKLEDVNTGNEINPVNGFYHVLSNEKLKITDCSTISYSAISHRTWTEKYNQGSPLAPVSFNIKNDSTSGYVTFYSANGYENNPEDYYSINLNANHLDCSGGEDASGDFNINIIVQDKLNADFSIINNLSKETVNKSPDGKYHLLAGSQYTINDASVSSSLINNINWKCNTSGTTPDDENYNFPLQENSKTGQISFKKALYLNDIGQKTNYTYDISQNVTNQSGMTDSCTKTIVIDDILSNIKADFDIYDNGNIVEPDSNGDYLVKAKDKIILKDKSSSNHTITTRHWSCFYPYSSGNPTSGNDASYSFNKANNDTQESIVFNTSKPVDNKYYGLSLTATDNSFSSDIASKKIIVTNDWNPNFVIDDDKGTAKYHFKAGDMINIVNTSDLPASSIDKTNIPYWTIKDSNGNEIKFGNFSPSVLANGPITVLSSIPKGTYYVTLTLKSLIDGTEKTSAIQTFDVGNGSGAGIDVVNPKYIVKVNGSLISPDAAGNYDVPLNKTITLVDTSTATTPIDSRSWADGYGNDIVKGPDSDMVTSVGTGTSGNETIIYVMFKSVDSYTINLDAEDTGNGIESSPYSRCFYVQDSQANDFTPDFSMNPSVQNQGGSIGITNLTKTIGGSLLDESNVDDKSWSVTDSNDNTYGSVDLSGLDSTWSGSDFTIPLTMPKGQYYLNFTVTAFGSTKTVKHPFTVISNENLQPDFSIWDESTRVSLQSDGCYHLQSGHQYSVQDNSTYDTAHNITHYLWGCNNWDNKTPARSNVALNIKYDDQSGFITFNTPSDTSNPNYWINHEVLNNGTFNTPATGKWSRKKVVVTNGWEPDFTINPKTAKAFSNVTFNNTTSGIDEDDVKDWTWTISDSHGNDYNANRGPGDTIDMSSLNDPDEREWEGGSIDIPNTMSEGSYTVTLSVTDKEGIAKTAKHVLQISSSDSENISFTLNPNIINRSETGLFERTINVLNTSSISQVNVLNFEYTVLDESGNLYDDNGNLDLSDLNDPSNWSSGHFVIPQDMENGTYTLQLSVTDMSGNELPAYGQSFTVTDDSHNVTPNGPTNSDIKADFTINHDCMAGDVVNVSNTSAATSTTIVSSAWKVEPNTGIISEALPDVNKTGAISFQNGGSYDVTLTVTGADGSQDSVTKTVNVKLPGPDARINCPSEAYEGDDIVISSATPKLFVAGTNNERYYVQYNTWSIDPQLNVNNFITNNQDNSPFTINVPNVDGETTYIVSLTVSCNGSSTANKAITIHPAVPVAQFYAYGNLKANRKVILDGSGSYSPSHYPILDTKTVWTITQNSTGKIIIIDKNYQYKAGDFIGVDSTTNLLKRNIVFKQSGDYTISLQIANSKYSSKIYTNTISIQPDLAPIADFYVQPSIIRDPDNNNLATVNIQDRSYSPDGDIIAKRIWTYKFDSDNDGSFDDETPITFGTEDNTNNETQPSFTVSHVGKYEIEEFIVEGFGQDTLSQFISDSDYMTGNTTLKPLSKKIIEVDNVAPSVDFVAASAKPKTKIDLLVNVGDFDWSKCSVIGVSNIQQLKTKIQSDLISKTNGNIDLNVMVTSSTLLKDGLTGVAWRPNSKRYFVNLSDSYSHTEQQPSETYTTPISKFIAIWDTQVCRGTSYTGRFTSGNYYFPKATIIIDTGKVRKSSDLASIVINNNFNSLGQIPWRTDSATLQPPGAWSSCSLSMSNMILSQKDLDDQSLSNCYFDYNATGGGMYTENPYDFVKMPTGPYSYVYYNDDEGITGNASTGNPVDVNVNGNLNLYIYVDGYDPNKSSHPGLNYLSYAANGSISPPEDIFRYFTVDLPVTNTWNDTLFYSQSSGTFDSIQDFYCRGLDDSYQLTQDMKNIIESQFNQLNYSITFNYKPTTASMTPQEFSDFNSNLNSNNVAFSAFETSANKEQTQQLGDYYDNSNMQSSLDSFENSVTEQCGADNQNPNDINTMYVLTDYSLSYSNIKYSDYEGDKEIASRWKFSQDDPSIDSSKYSHYIIEPNNDINPLDNYLGTISENNQWLSSPLSNLNMPGTYLVTLEAQDNPSKDNGFTKYNKWSTPSSMLIVVVRKPIAKFTARYTKNGDGSYTISNVTDNSYSIDHTSLSDKGIATKDWGYYDANNKWVDLGSSAPSVLPTGSLKLALKVKSIEGFWSDEAILSLASNAVLPPIAQFTENPKTIYEGGTITIADTSYSPSGNAISETWTVTGTDASGNNIYSFTGNSCPPIYNSIGNYTIILTVKDNVTGAVSDPAYDSFCVISKAAVLQPPTANFSVTPVFYQDNNSPEPVWTNNSKANAPGATIANYEIEVYPHETDHTGNNLLYSYSDAAFSNPDESQYSKWNVNTSYDMILKVTDSNGQVSSPFTQTFTIANRPPKALFTISNTAFYEDNTVNGYMNNPEPVFTDMSSEPDYGDSITNYNINIYRYGTNLNPVYAYSGDSFMPPEETDYSLWPVGKYTMTLTAEDMNGGISVPYSIDITIKDRPPIADFTLNQYTFEADNKNIRFMDNSNDPDYGDSINSYIIKVYKSNTTDNPVYSYYGSSFVPPSQSDYKNWTAGTYHIILTVSDNHGLISAPCTHTITITNVPIVQPTGNYYVKALFTVTPASFYEDDNHPKINLRNNPNANYPDKICPFFDDNSLALSSDGSPNNIASEDWAVTDSKTNQIYDSNRAPCQNDYKSWPVGNYTITLTVFDKYNNYDKCSKCITIMNRNPIASFTMNVSSVYEDNSHPRKNLRNNPDFFITDNSKDYDYGDKIASEHWEIINSFGKAIWTDSLSPTKESFKNIPVGNYTITLSVKDTFGWTDECSQNLKVMNRNPVADFTINTPSFYEDDSDPYIEYRNNPEPVITDNSYDIDYEDFISCRNWEVTNANGQDIFKGKTPPEASDYKNWEVGQYNIILTVTDSFGWQDTAMKTINILDRPPIAKFSISSSEFYVNYSDIKFTDESYDLDKNDYISSRSWQVYDPNGKLVFNQTVPPGAANMNNWGEGIYSVYLVVKDSYGSLSIPASKLITVLAPSVSNFRITDIYDYNWQKVFRDKNNNHNGFSFPVSMMPVTNQLAGVFPYKGYGFSFSMDTKGLNKDTDTIVIIPQFYYINYPFDSTNILNAQKCDLYYDDSEKYLIKAGDPLRDNFKFKYNPQFNKGLGKIVLDSSVRKNVDSLTSTWSGEYGVPWNSKFIKSGTVVFSGTKFLEKNFLKGGYVLINFSIKAYRNGKMIFDYVNDSNGWSKEGGPRDKTLWCNGDTIIYDDQHQRQDTYDIQTIM